ncbi:acyltransferase [Pseudomonas nitroreducens]|uniref:acyltransferase n=1 Tax=Pseudomonas nitroreducens TaxID=46680 RepID=UPI0026596C6D|nr:acyltransferase [Pseudomonas nitroreducens]MCP1646792.1 1-acyl-sn-glycerol-3-phosphate acyltransferase [Pseudomonas nitroreducens]MCP1685368.1 1-acyl-sn-glycerol-3-phosphate acyltransferase [Pseudomonas nitroreducens]
MLSFLPHTLRGILATLILVVSTLCWCIPLLGMSIIKLLLPFNAAQLLLSKVMSVIAESWITCNKGWMNLVGKTRWNVEGLQGLHYDHSYLVTSNHQSWVDILVLQYQLNRRLPLLRFFLKQELIWVPVIGLCWWALDFPFMKRYTKAYLAKHPEKKGKDLETTRKACAKFSRIPVAIFNFLEGTRFTQEKHDEQASPFQHLLKPKAGGIAFVLDAMGEQLRTLVNVTIHYPDGRPTFWCLLSGKLHSVVVRFEELEIPRQFIGKSYDQDEGYRAEFQLWVNQLWERKDQLLAQLHREFPAKA